jgi:hypothetical protein
MTSLPYDRWQKEHLFGKADDWIRGKYFII